MIRWVSSEEGSLRGYVGTWNVPLFLIIKTRRESELATSIPGRQRRRIKEYDTDALKEGAEQMLIRFMNSLYADRDLRPDTPHQQVTQVLSEIIEMNDQSYRSVSVRRLRRVAEKAEGLLLAWASDDATADV